MHIGICMTVYNRPDYLIQTVDSLEDAMIGQTVVVVDDCSTDDRTIGLLSKLRYRVIKTHTRSNVYGALKLGISKLIELDCTHIIILDSDAIVKPNFIEKLTELQNKFPNQIVTGFNCTTKDKDGKERHRIIDAGEGWNKKHSIGGINMMFSVETYKKYVLPELDNCIRLKKGQWDMNVCKRIGGAYSTVPSVVQHIGFYSSMGHMHDYPDVADDFDHEPVKNATELQKPQHKEKVAIIQQFMGIGDVIFCAELVKRIMHQGYKILWPVLPEYIEGCNRAYPFFTFIDYNLVKIDYNNREDIERNGVRLIPLRFTDQLQRVPFRDCMRSKYDHFGKDWTEWRKTQPFRNYDREYALAELVGAKGDYTLVNTKFRSNQSGSITLPPIDGNVIEMRNVPGYSLFDWMTVIENAKQIHTVSTSIIYLMELVNLQCEPHIYIRRPDENSHQNYDYIMTRNKYQFMDNSVPTTGKAQVKALVTFRDLKRNVQVRHGEVWTVDIDRANYLVSANKVTIVGYEPEPMKKAEVSHTPKMRY